MARKPGSGGARVGAPQTAYAQRTDLNQPVKTAPGQPYGVAQQQAQAQKIIPLPTQNANPAVGAAPGGSPVGSPPTGPPPGPAAVAPGSFGDFHRETERPNEPLTAGLSSGAGPGPEVLGLGAPSAQGNISQMLDALARNSGSSDLQILAQRARQMGQ